MHKIIALWTHPRSLSTALERVMMARGDCKILHEPFSYLYYFHDKKGTIPYHHKDANHPTTYPDIKKHILAIAESVPVFCKDMGYHCGAYLIEDEGFINKLINTFLIREPAKSIASHYALNPKVSLEEIGYEQAFRIFQKVIAITTKIPPVINADDLQNNPQGIIKAYCEAVGMAYLPHALHWTPGHKPQWDTWKEWHIDAASSSGIHADSNRYPITVHNNPRLRAYYEHHLPFYEAMAKHCIPVE